MGLSIALGLIITAGNFAQGEQPQGIPIATLSEAEHTIEYNPAAPVVEHSFPIGNVGTAPLKILRIKTSCACALDYPSSRIVSPGQTAFIKVGFRDKSSSGMQRINVILYTNDPFRPELHLTLTLVNQRPIFVRPQIIDFGEGPFGHAVETTLSIFSAEPLRQPSITASSDSIHVRYMGKRIIDGWYVFDYQARAELSSNATVLDEALVCHTSSLTQPFIEIPVKATRLLRLEMTPPQLIVNTGSGNAEAHLKQGAPGITLPLEARLRRSSGLRVSIRADEQMANTWILTVDVPTAPNGLISTAVEVYDSTGEMVGSLPILIPRMGAGSHK